MLGVAVVAAVLPPQIPWTLELYALRRLTKSAFGTLMALESAIALVIGLVERQQVPTASKFIGIGCVVVAGMRPNAPEIATTGCRRPSITREPLRRIAA